MENSILDRRRFYELKFSLSDVHNCDFLINVIDWPLPNELLLHKFPLHQHNYSNSNYHLLFFEKLFRKSNHRGSNTKQFNNAVITFDFNCIFHSINWQVFNFRRSYFIFYFCLKHTCKTIWERFLIFTIIFIFSITLIFIKYSPP